MNWRIKAAIQLACDVVPIGKEALYRQLQLRCGGLVKGYDHSFLLSEAARMTGMLRGVGFDVQDATVMEVGTGWRVDMPMGFYLCGARKIITCDLHRYLEKRLTLDTVRYVANNADKIRGIFSFVEPAQLDERIARLGRIGTIEELFRTTSIEYHAPCDCAHTHLADRSIDLHYSYTVFEHIPASTLLEILREANRLLSDRGVALHHIDLGDHFAQVDPSITPTNFLQFSETAWRRYAKTPWSYHNRLREDEYRSLFESVPQDILYWKAHIDERSLESLRQGFPLAPQFREKPVEVLSVALLDVISRPAWVTPGSVHINYSASRHKDAIAPTVPPKRSCASPTNPKTVHKILGRA
jgi:SAM-dependent methyltransferase